MSLLTLKLSGSVTVRANHITTKIRDVKAATATATWMGAQAVLAEAQRRVGRGKTLELADSLQIVGKEGDEHLRVGSVGGGGKGKPVARFVENGTVKMHARPFLRPGAAMGRRVLKAEGEARVKRAADG